MSQSHIANTVGGLRGYILRRVVHVAIGIVPLLYYAYGAIVAQFFHLTAPQLLLVVIGLNVVIEVFRLKFKWTLLGHRVHEARTISSFAWGVLSLCLVLLFAPGKEYAIPIIWSCALVDPLLGELRRTELNRDLVMLIGMIVVALIWWLATVWLGTAWQLALLMGPLIVGLEAPNFRWIDDNALMQIVPLLIILLLYD